MQYQVKTSAIIHEFLEDEVIVANLDSGIYYSIQDGGRVVWQLLTASVPIDAIKEIFFQKYKKDISDLLETFIKQTVDEDLLIPRQEQSHYTLPDLNYPESFHTIVLEKYDEVKSLLALDPIHEVDKQGWPVKPNATV